jgi:hypothetical protein
MISLVPLTAEDFLMELRLAQAWSIGKSDEIGRWELWVSYPFGMFGFLSSNVIYMFNDEAASFVDELRRLVSEPPIEEVTYDGR